MSTGIYIRVLRDGKWQSLLLDDCTPDEMLPILNQKTGPELVLWVCYLVGYIRASNEINDKLRQELATK